MIVSHNIATPAVANCPGELIRLLRQCRGCKQQMVAKKMGISQQALSKIENASFVPPEKVAAILAILKCTKADLKKISSLMPGASQ